MEGLPLPGRLLGFPFCLPDMIGGNAYFGQRPDQELMVRWAQVNALMPAMQVGPPATALLACPFGGSLAAHAGTVLYPSPPRSRCFQHLDLTAL